MGVHMKWLMIKQMFHSSSILRNGNNYSYKYQSHQNPVKLRDDSIKGQYIRNKFENVLKLLITEGTSRENARKEMLKIFKDNLKSAIL